MTGEPAPLTDTREALAAMCEDETYAPWLARQEANSRPVGMVRFADDPAKDYQV